MAVARLACEKVQDNPWSVDHNSKRFIESMDHSPLMIDPYPHFIMSDIFDPTLIKALDNLPFLGYNLDYRLGTREEFNPNRYYFNPEVIEKHSEARTVAEIFLNQEILSAVEARGNISLKNSLLRIEYTIDQGNFWLKPHTDLGVKLFTMLLYLTDGPGSISWGTDIYRDADTHFTTVAYIPNSALVFYPTEQTWHGFEPRNINGVRRSLIINYVTQEWRNRHELVHSTQSVY